MRASEVSPDSVGLHAASRVLNTARPACLAGSVGRLNTCIGTRNYFYFFVLAVTGEGGHSVRASAPVLTSRMLPTTGTLQFALETVVGVLLLSYWFTPRLQGVIRQTMGPELEYKVSHVT